jgi:hypothetical protein
LKAKYIVHNKKSNSKVKHELSLKVCSQDIGFEKTFNLLCLDDENLQKDSLILKGNFFSDDFRYIEILFLPCNENILAEVQCGSFESVM